MNSFEPTWLLLPPEIRTRLSSEGFVDEGDIIDSELLRVTLRRLTTNPTLRERLLEEAAQIIEDIFESPGWGTWPVDLGEAVYIGSFLGVWLEQGLTERICELSSEELADFETESRRSGRSIERICLEALVQHKEG